MGNPQSTPRLPAQTLLNIWQQRTGIIIFSVLILFVCSCVTPPKKAAKPSPPARKAETPKPELKEIVMPQKGATLVSSQKTYTLQMRDADIQDLLLAFSREINANIVVDPKISGRVTIDLKGVTLEQVLDVVCGQLNLEYKREGNLIKVFKPSLDTRIFFLDYITTVRKGKGLASGGVGGRSSSGTQGSGSGTSAGSTSGSEQTSAGYSEVTTADESDLWKDIDKGLQSLKSTDGVIIVHKTSNTVLVKDYPAQIRKIAEYLELVTGSVQRQVLIEAQIIEVYLDNTFKAGIDWGYIQSLPQMSNLSWGLATNGASPWLGYPGSTNTNQGSSGSSGTGSQTQPIPGDWKVKPFGGIFRIGGPDQIVALNDIIEALSTQGDVNIISSPKISTLNNQPAIIKVAREDPYFQTTRQTVYGESNTTTEVNFISIGVVLAVTPQIGSDGIITLTIHPSVTDKVGEATSVQGDKVPIVDVRETDTVVRVNDRQTILFAGLMQNKVTEDVIAVPLVSEIPWLGYLFKHTSREVRKTELVIMLTPKVVTSENMRELAAPEQQRLEK
ncbi:MAG: secretin N-terminal domain-containing protein [Proteobacteria bacterium]|nr:secretin N-terminal domain-containing protein [Pseudomonadota bacterium]